MFFTAFEVFLGIFGRFYLVLTVRGRGYISLYHDPLIFRGLRFQKKNPSGKKIPTYGPLILSDLCRKGGS